MTIQLEIPEEIERRLTKDAQAHGMDAAAYLLSLIERTLLPETEDTRGIFTPETLEAFIRDMALPPGRAPHLPDEAFSRASIYQDHD